MNRKLFYLVSLAIFGLTACEKPAPPPTAPLEEVWKLVKPEPLPVPKANPQLPWAYKLQATVASIPYTCLFVGKDEIDTAELSGGAELLVMPKDKTGNLFMGFGVQGAIAGQIDENGISLTLSPEGVQKDILQSELGQIHDICALMRQGAEDVQNKARKGNGPVKFASLSRDAIESFYTLRRQFLSNVQPVVR